jgi:hypothetical protein
MYQFSFFPNYSCLLLQIELTFISAKLSCYGSTISQSALPSVGNLRFDFGRKWEMDTVYWSTPSIFIFVFHGRNEYSEYTTGTDVKNTVCFGIENRNQRQHKIANHHQIAPWRRKPATKPTCSLVSSLCVHSCSF